MASITIHHLDEATKARLRARAAKHGRSMEAEARDILKEGLAVQGDSQNLADAIHARFALLGGLELPEIPRGPMRDPPTFDE